MTLRSLIFWPHLAAGAVAGLVILALCVTGTLLTFERQLIAWSDSRYRSVIPSDGASRASIAAVVDSVTREGLAAPASVTIAADPAAPVTVVAGGKTVYADAYSGVVLGEASTTVRTIMRELRNWHRWLATDGESRAAARAATGWATVLFAFIVVTGAYLWIPRSMAQLRAVVRFRGGLRAKARDFNWHNVVGVWSCVPLFIIAVSAWPISFAWANAVIYRAVGEEVPAGPVRGEATPRAGQRAEAARDGRRAPRFAEPERSSSPIASIDSRTLDSLLERSRHQEPGWRTITIRWPASATTPVQFSIDRSDGGRPQTRSTLTLTRAGDVVRYETFQSQTPARRLRSLLRFAHTGEVLGVPGQMVAGLASAGGAVLVWTGLSLVCRRGAGWLRRRRAVVVTPASAIDSAA